MEIKPENDTEDIRIAIWRNLDYDMQIISSDDDYFIDNTNDKAQTEDGQNENSDSATILVTHKLDEPIVCASCSKCFYNRSFYEEHKLKIIDRKSCLYIEDVCNVCDEVIGNLDDKQIRSHIGGHLLKETYFCQHCHRFEKASMIEQYEHFMTIYSEKRYICRQCRDSFVNKVDLDDHIHEIHPCLKKFPKYIRKLTRHMCELCGKLVGSLPEHMKVHKNIRPYQCVKCENRFRTKFNVIRHQQAHRHKLTVCDECGKNFYWAETFHTHLKKVHPTDDPHSFVCRYCSSKFQYKQAMEVHENVHRPYDCSNCETSFEFPEYLRAHHYNIHAELPFVEQAVVYDIKCPDVSMKNFHMNTEYWETATAETKQLMNDKYESQKSIDELAAYASRTARAEAAADRTSSSSTSNIGKTASLNAALDKCGTIAKVNDNKVAYKLPTMASKPENKMVITSNIKKNTVKADDVKREIGKFGVDTKVVYKLPTTSQKAVKRKIEIVPAGKYDFTTKIKKSDDVTPAAPTLKKVDLKELLLTCKDCNIYFKNEIQLIDHRTKTHKKTFRCKMCGIHTDKIMEHILQHRYCFVCKTKFETAAALTLHRQKVHPPKSEYEHSEQRT